MDAYELYLHGKELFDKGSYEQAAELFCRSILQEEHFKSYEKLADCSLKTGCTKAAEEYYRHAYELNPHNDQVSYKLAKCICKREPDNAAKLLKGILKRNPTYKKAALLLSETNSKG